MSSTDQNSAREVAAHLGLGFKYHDRRNRQEAVDSFTEVDRFQFQHLGADTARRAAAAYVDALWAKDDVEDSHSEDGVMDRQALDEADWSPVRRAFERRAALAGIDPAYAELSTIGWRRHKTGGDYWTPLMEAQMYELQAALQNEAYPQKPRYGASGFGPEAVRYLLGVELHDMRLYKQGVQAMTPYFQRIADGHADNIERQPKW